MTIFAFASQNLAIWRPAHTHGGLLEYRVYKSFCFEKVIIINNLVSETTVHDVVAQKSSNYIDSTDSRRLKQVQSV